MGSDTPLQRLLPIEIAFNNLSTSTHKKNSQAKITYTNIATLSSIFLFFLFNKNLETPKYLGAVQQKCRLNFDSRRPIRILLFFSAKNKNTVLIMAST